MAAATAVAGERALAAGDAAPSDTATATAAAAATAPPKQQQQVLLLIKGLPGTGKSALALALARRLRWPIVDKDDVRDALELCAAAAAAAAAAACPAAPAAAVASQQQQSQQQQSQQQQSQQQPQQQQQQEAQPQGAGMAAALDLNAASYEAMFRFAAAQLRAGLSAVVDCPFSRRALYDRACALAAEHGAAVALVDCAASDAAAWRARLEARARADAAAAPERRHKPRGWEDLERLLDGYDGCWRWSHAAAPPLPRRFEVDTTALAPAEAAAAVARWLAREGLLEQEG